MTSEVKAWNDDYLLPLSYCQTYRLCSPRPTELPFSMCPISIHQHTKYDKGRRGVTRPTWEAQPRLFSIFQKREFGRVVKAPDPGSGITDAWVRTPQLSLLFAPLDYQLRVTFFTKFSPFHILIGVYLSLSAVLYSLSPYNPYIWFLRGSALPRKRLKNVCRWFVAIQAFQRCCYSSIIITTMPPHHQKPSTFSLLYHPP